MSETLKIKGKQIITRGPIFTKKWVYDIANLYWLGLKKRRFLSNRENEKEEATQNKWKSAR